MPASLPHGSLMQLEWLYSLYCPKYSIGISSHVSEQHHALAWVSLLFFFLLK